MMYPVKPRARRNAILFAVGMVAITLASGPIRATEFPNTTGYELAQSRPGGGRPPREALQVCETKSSGDACSFTVQDGTTVKGTCRSPEANVPAACVPVDGPPKS